MHTFDGLQIVNPSRYLYSCTKVEKNTIPLIYDHYKHYRDLFAQKEPEHCYYCNAITINKNPFSLKIALA